MKVVRNVCLIFSMLLVCCLLGTMTVMAEDVKVEPTIEQGIAWYDTQKWAPEGQAWREGLERYYARFPLRYKEKLVGNVWNLSQHSAGLFFRFRTDANMVKVKFRMFSKILELPHMPRTGVSGLDLYMRNAKKQWRWVGNLKSGYEGTKTLVDHLVPGMKEFILFLPLYNGIELLEIGVPQSAEFSAIAPVKEKSILYYGSSITQGCGASRPGNVFTAIISRRFDIPVLNFGFSGNARMDLGLAEIFAELDPVLYVFDPLPNMSQKGVEERAQKFIEIIRAKHPTTPILLVEDIGYSNDWCQENAYKSMNAKNAALKKVFDHLVVQGDKNLYYLERKDIFGEDSDFEETVDGRHPNDLGMYKQAEALERVIRPILGK